jgi:hypothetical protein
MTIKQRPSWPSIVAILLSLVSCGITLLSVHRSRQAWEIVDLLSARLGSCERGTHGVRTLDPFIVAPADVYEMTGKRF